MVKEPGRSVVDGAVRVLQALPETGGRHQLRDLADITGLPRPTVYRLLRQLVESGVVESGSDGVHRLGSALVALGRRVEPALGLRATAIPILADLRERTGATVALVAGSSAGAVVLEAMPGRARLPIAVFSGRILPPSAAGAAVLPQPNQSSQRTEAIDNEDLVTGLTCWATRLHLDGDTAVSLQLASPPHPPAHTFAAAARHAALLISKRLKDSADLRL